jgi:hypothetical protein
MRFKTQFERTLYSRVAASVHAALINKGRTKPSLAAHVAREHAEAAVTESRITQRSKA